MRLIDADAERERLKKGYCKECIRKGNYGIFGAACTPCWVKDAIKEFDNAQTVEAEPVRHGRWIECDYKTLEHGEIESAYKAGLCCSECRTGFKKNHMTYKAFCPACGARMDGGADNA